MQNSSSSLTSRILDSSHVREEVCSGIIGFVLCDEMLKNRKSFTNKAQVYLNKLQKLYRCFTNSNLSCDLCDRRKINNFTGLDYTFQHFKFLEHCVSYAKKIIRRIKLSAK